MSLKEYVKQNITGYPFAQVRKCDIERFAEQIDKRFSEHIEAEGQFSREMSADLEKKIESNENRIEFHSKIINCLEERIKALEENKGWTEARLATMFKSIELLENKPRIFKNPTFGMGIEPILCEKKEPIWQDITQQCEFVPQTDIINEFWIKIKYNELVIGGIAGEIWINTLFQENFKIEKSKYTFKILKKANE